MSDIGLCDFSLPVPLLREREIKRDNLSPYPKGEWWREGLLLTFCSLSYSALRSNPNPENF